MLYSPVFQYLYKAFKRNNIQWYILGFMGTCHNCDSKIEAPFKFVKDGADKIGREDVNVTFCFPLVCSYCGMKHYKALAFSETSRQRVGEKVHFNDNSTTAK
jgi:hypothetical protein